MIDLTFAIATNRRGKACAVQDRGASLGGPLSLTISNSCDFAEKLVAENIPLETLRFCSSASQDQRRPYRQPHEQTYPKFARTPGYKASSSTAAGGANQANERSVVCHALKVLTS